MVITVEYNNIYMSNMSANFINFFESKKHFSALYFNYKELMTNHIKNSNCFVFFDYNDGCGIVRAKEPIDYDTFIKKDPEALDQYGKCVCIADDYNYKVSGALFMEACKKTNIDQAKCLNIFDLSKLKKINNKIAQKLTTSCVQKCTIYTSTQES
jgi:hypothetical protein